MHGKLPWKLSKTPVKEWAQSWADTNAEELVTMVRQYLPEATNEQIISLLHDLEKDEMKLPVAEGNKRDMAVASHMIRELLRATTVTLREMANKIMTVWEFSQSNNDKTDDNSILGWLFKRR